MRLRSLFTLTGLSAFCCAALLLVWILSHLFLIQVALQTVTRFADSPSGVDEDAQYYVVVSSGELSAARSRGGMCGFSTAEFAKLHLRRGERRWLWTIASTESLAPPTSAWFGTNNGYRVYSGGVSTIGTVGFEFIHLRILLVAPIFIALPVIQIVRKILRARSRRNACRNCGYDMRATPHRCPECGKISTGAAFAAAVNH